MPNSNPVVHYELAIDSINKHLFSIVMHIPSMDESSFELSLPAWIPGSYMIRDFARNIIEINALNESKTTLKIAKTDKQTWLVHNPTKQPVIVNYKVFAFDLSVRSAFINDEYAFCNGTSIFLNPGGKTNFTYRLSVELGNIPQTWQLYTSMPKSSEAENETFECTSYLEFIDHPIFIGKCQVDTFRTGDVDFTVLFSGDDPIDTQRICNDLAPICLHHIKMFDDKPPVSAYLFITLLSDKGYGGLEHINSTALLFPRFDLPLQGESESSGKSDNYINFLSLCSHEFFHTWNVKRIKPEVMIEPDLQSEVYTSQLWIYEGFTSFYDELAVARAGIISPQQYIELLGKNLTRVMQSAGRNKQSVAESSFDAWTRFYKQDASSTNHIVSYYVKGGLIAFGLDLLIRKQSDNQYSLDDLMRVLWREHGRPGIGTFDEVVGELCQQHFSIDVTSFLQDVVHGTEDVPFNQWLHLIGLSVHQSNKISQDGNDNVDTANRTHCCDLGMSVNNSECGVIVQQVREDKAACLAGLQLNDRIVAVDGYEVNEGLIQRLVDTCSKQSLPMTVIRDGRLLSLTLPVLAAEPDTYFFKIDNQTLFNAWLRVD